MSLFDINKQTNACDIRKTYRKKAIYDTVIYHHTFTELQNELRFKARETTEWP